MAMMQKALCCFVVIAILMSLMPVFIPEVSAALCPFYYMGTVISKDTKSNAITIQTDYEYTGEWSPCSCTLEGKAPNENAINEINVGDYVEAHSLGSPGGSWRTLAKIKSSAEKVITDIYGDPFGFRDKPPLLGDYKIEYESRPNCSKCYGMNCDAVYTTVNVYKDSTQVVNKLLYPNQNYVYHGELYSIDITFLSGQAHSYPECTNELCVGPQGISNFVVHIVSKDDDNITYVTMNNGKIYHDGNAVNLYGVSWFGFETQDHIVHGLWSRDYKGMIAQMKALGFNAVRIPFCPATLKNVNIAPGLIDYSKNPDLEGLKSLEVMDKIIDELNRKNMYILLDHHRPDCIEISELWYTDSFTEKEWINDLIFIVKRYKNINYFFGIDLKNEPHGIATWGTGNVDTDWKLAVEKASQAILVANPNILIFVEGIQENPVCSSSINHWWGGNLEPEHCFPINVASGKLVFSPHVYGPDVYNQPYFADECDFPNNMPLIWDTHFGYLTDQGYTIAIGEFGGKYGHGGDPKDIVWQNSIIDYFIGKHICNFFYWSWNPNSGDTGGILQDDWINIWQDKYDNLKRLIDACNDTYPVKAPPTYQNIGLCDPSCQSSAPMRVSDGQLDVCFNYSRNINAIAGVMSSDFRDTWWLNPDCRITSSYVQAITSNKYLSCPDINLPSAALDGGYLFWLVTESDLSSLDWTNGVYELLFYKVEECPTRINGVCVNCSTDCASVFSGNISAIVQCESWKDCSCDQ